MRCRDAFKLDRGTHGATHLLDHLIERKALHWLLIEVRDGHDAGFRRRRVVDRGDDLDRAFLHGHFDAKASELAAGLAQSLRDAVGLIDLKNRTAHEGGVRSADGAVICVH
jgi:hypothetical protein